jgi:hypothetical protein
MDVSAISNDISFIYGMIVNFSFVMHCFVLRNVSTSSLYDQRYVLHMPEVVTSILYLSTRQ